MLSEIGHYEDIKCDIDANLIEMQAIVLIWIVAQLVSEADCFTHTKLAFYYQK
jgi:hypothetical protein